MNVVGLVMAGGRGERARRSIADISKPLLEVGGVTLIERNLLALVEAGFRKLVVSVSAADSALSSFVADRCGTLVGSWGGSLELLAERWPRGNIGCAAELRGRGATVLVVFADNLTSMSLHSIVRSHVEHDADLTLATHREAIPIPYGEVRVRQGRVTEYSEKPVHRVLICSGIAVLGERALAAIPADEAMGISQLARKLIDQGALVREYRHSASWVDVNDAASLSRAELLFSRSQREFTPPSNDPRADRSRPLVEAGAPHTSRRPG
ncbi:MAG TPA: sugar phosphate nucleotidyltransferase [Longimicrobiaceae bacterium]